LFDNALVESANSRHTRSSWSTDPIRTAEDDRRRRASDACRGCTGSTRSGSTATSTTSLRPNTKSPAIPKGEPNCRLETV